MNTLVVDASIAVKWVVEEDGTAAALALRGKGRLVAPDLLTAECANILWKKVRRGELLPDEAYLAARLLVRADIELFSMRALLEEATRLAVALDHAAYHCVCLALALGSGWRFVTADERFLRKVRQHPSTALAGAVVGLAEATEA
jgi:Predicted nucleic acid-binding protein, contains PIN domain